MNTIQQKLSRVVSIGKNKMATKGALIFVVAFALIGAYLVFRSFAAAPEVYLTPATGTVNQGENFTVDLRVNPGTSVDGVEATVNYDTAKLQFVSIDATNTAFPIQLTNSGGNGTVSIVRGVLAPTVVSADSLVAKVTFKALSTASGSTNLQLSGNATAQGAYINPSMTGAVYNISAPQTPSTLTASYSLESSVASPVANTAFKLKLYVDTNANIAGGEVKVNLPSGVTYSGTLDTAGTAFSPVSTVEGTTNQIVYIVYATQSQNLTGKQLVASIPVTSSTTGSKTITMSGQRLINTNDTEISGVSAQSLNLTVNSPLAKPTLSIPGKATLTASEKVEKLGTEFTISNYDSTATYTVTVGGTSASVSAGKFTIPNSVLNGDHELKVEVSKNSSTNVTTLTVQLRSPNVNRTGCVELRDLLAVNKAYGTNSIPNDLNFDGTVSLIDLLKVTASWGGECIS